MISRARASACSRSIVMSSETIENAWGKYRTPTIVATTARKPSISQKAGRFTRVCSLKVAGRFEARVVYSAPAGAAVPATEGHC